MPLDGSRSDLDAACTGQAQTMGTTSCVMPDALFFEPHGVIEVLTELVPSLGSLAQELIQKLPARLRASPNLRAHCRAPWTKFYNLGQASTLPWVCPNSKNRLVALLFDVDHVEGPDLAWGLQCYFGLPHPIVVQDPFSGRSHIIVCLQKPIFIDQKADIQAMERINLAHSLLAIHLRATPLPHSSLVKWPFGRLDAVDGYLPGRCAIGNGVAPRHPDLWEAYQQAATGLCWQTDPGTGPVTIDAIVEALASTYAQHLLVDGQTCSTNKEDSIADLAGPPRLIVPTRVPGRRNNPVPSTLGRNCGLFDLVRAWAYAHVERNDARLLEEAQRLNTTETYRSLSYAETEPLDERETSIIVKSIGTFMRERYTGKGKRHPRDWAKGVSLTADNKRRLAGRATAAQRFKVVDERIRAARAAFAAEGQTPTLSALAQRAGVHRATVARHRADSRRRADSGCLGVVDAMLSGSAPVVTSEAHPDAPGCHETADTSQCEVADAPASGSSQAAPVSAGLSAPSSRRGLGLFGGRLERAGTRDGLVSPTTNPDAAGARGEASRSTLLDERIRCAVAAMVGSGSPMHVETLARIVSCSPRTLRRRPWLRLEMRQARETDSLVRCLKALTEEATTRGARTPSLPDVPWRLQGHPTVRAALAAAEVAVEQCREREISRETRLAGQRQREEDDRLLIDIARGPDADASFRRFIGGRTEYWDARVASCHREAARQNMTFARSRALKRLRMKWTEIKMELSS